MSVDVSMAVEVRRRKSGVDHAIDLCPAFEIYVRRIKASERSPTEQGRQRVELAGIPSCQRRCACNGPPNRKIEVKPHGEVGG